MKLYKFMLLPKKHVPVGRVATMLQATRRYISSEFPAETRDGAVICHPGIVRGTEDEDLLTNLFIHDWRDEEVWLKRMTVTYFNVFLGSEDQFVAYSPQEIFQVHRVRQSVKDAPIFVECHPRAHTVTLVAQFKEGAVSASKGSVLTFRRECEKVLDLSQRTHQELTRSLQVWKTPAKDFLRRFL